MLRVTSTLLHGDGSFAWPSLPKLMDGNHTPQHLTHWLAFLPRVKPDTVEHRAAVR